jgi:hypothetical protein
MPTPKSFCHLPQAPVPGPEPGLSEQAGLEQVAVQMADAASHECPTFDQVQHFCVQGEWHSQQLPQQSITCCRWLPQDFRQGGISITEVVHPHGGYPPGSNGFQAAAGYGLQLRLAATERSNTAGAFSLHEGQKRQAEQLAALAHTGELMGSGQQVVDEGDCGAHRVVGA